MATESIHERFRLTVAAGPQVVALVEGPTRITYGELDAASDAMAARLAREGFGPGQIVVVLVPPGALLAVVLLAVLKRGAAYTVVDPAWPGERQRHVAATCEPTAIVAPGVDTGAFTRTWTAAADFTATGKIPPAEVVAGDDPAMVFFTSGTTGPPKAVLSPHRAALRLVRDCPFARLDRTTVMPQAAPASWDAFALELWGVLLTGGTSMVPAERPITPAALRALGVNTIFLTTSLFHLFVDEDVAAFAGLRCVITGGEVLSPAHAGRFLAAHPEIRLVNGYGPVESTVFALYHDVTLDDVRGDVPIGRPVPGTSVVVLDGDRECAPDEVGELCIGGEGLALEYVGDPEQTARRFVEVAGQRRYRTGDRGSVSADGVFRFAGRTDRQVKVRGHRVEPAAIEHVAAEVSGVPQAVVVPVLGETGNCEALALFFRAAPDGPAPRELAAALRMTLPSYSVPDVVRAVPAFPLTPNGKLDQARLAEMAVREATPCQRTGGSVFDAVAAEFAAVLGTPDVDVDSSFFAQGGASLAAIRLCTRLGVAHDRVVPISQLSRTPSVKALAAWLEQPAADVEGADLTPTQLSFLLAHEDSDNDVENHCCLAWEVTGPLRADALADAVRDVHERHAYLAMRYDLEDPPVPASGPAPLVVVDGEHAELERELSRPFALADGHVWRCVLASDGARSLLGVNVHHIAFDGWSEHLLATDLGIAYAARSQGVAPDFGAPAQGVSAVRALLAGTACADLPAQRRYWADALAGLPPLALPAIATPSPVPHLVEHPLPDLGGLDRLAARYGTGRLAILVTAVASALRELTGQDDFGIGVPVSLRGTAASEQVISCLINTVCVRPGEGLANTTAVVSDALAHSDLPFPEVVRAVGARTRSGRRPLYQVLAAVHDAPRPVLRLAGAQVTPHRLTPGVPPAEVAVELLVGKPVVRVSVDGRVVPAEVAERLGAAVRDWLGWLC